MEVPPGTEDARDCKIHVTLKFGDTEVMAHGWEEETQKRVPARFKFHTHTM